MSADFLSGGGELGELMRAKEWSATPVGAAEFWPQGLRTALRILLNTRHPMYIFWGDEGLCFYNDAYRLSIGPERHPGSLGQPAKEVWEEIWPIIGPQIQQVMAGGGATWHENALVPITRNGIREDVYWTYSYGPIDDDTADNNVGGVLVICTETTKQIELARRLAASDERLNLALSAGRGVGTWDWDVRKDQVVADTRFARLYGVDPADAARGIPVADFFTRVHPEDVPQLRERVAHTLRTGAAFTAEYRLIQPDGGDRWVVSEGRCELASDGTPVRFPGISFDITARKQIELELRDLNITLERKVTERALERGRTWELSPELLGVINSQGIFETSNPAWQTILGWTAKEIASQQFFGFIHPDDLPRTHQAWNNAIKLGLPALRFENRCRSRSGQYRWLSWVAVPQDGKVYCSARDVTEQKEQAEALTRAEHRLRQSHKMEAVGQLTGGIAHDFNNLLAAIGGSLEVVEKSLAQGRQDLVDRYLTAGKGAVRRAASLTQRLLAFSRQQTLQPKAISLTRLVRGIEDMVRQTVGPQIEVVVLEEAALWPTFVDLNQLENALLNLCINARDAMPDGGRLAIQSGNHSVGASAAKELEMPTGDYVLLAVSDTGVGMAPDVIAKAIDPFFTTKPLGAGTGLGLSMVYGLARQSGGQMQIRSKTGQGTTISIYLPRHGFEAELHDETLPERAPVPAAGHGVILVVDDEPTVRMLILEELQAAGYATLEEADGPSAMVRLQSSARIDLLVTDVGLPGGMNGRQVAEAARILRPGLKVLFVTGYAESAAVGSDVLGQGMEILCKPFAMDAVARKAKEMLEA